MGCAHLARLAEEASPLVMPWHSNTISGLEKVRLLLFFRSSSFLTEIILAPFACVSTLRRVLDPGF